MGHAAMDHVPPASRRSARSTAVNGNNPGPSARATLALVRCRVRPATCASRSSTAGTAVARSRARSPPICRLEGAGRGLGHRQPVVVELRPAQARRKRQAPRRRPRGQFGLQGQLGGRVRGGVAIKQADHIVQRARRPGRRSRRCSQRTWSISVAAGIRSWVRNPRLTAASQCPGGLVGREPAQRRDLGDRADPVRMVASAATAWSAAGAPGPRSCAAVPGSRAARVRRAPARGPDRTPMPTGTRAGRSTRGIPARTAPPRRSSPGWIVA